VGGISKFVDRLESAGYCRRTPNPGDRRSSLVELTPAGRELFAAASEVVDDELERRIGAVLSVRSREQFVRTLTRLRSAGHRLDATVAAQAG
jgi:DNA-binding MarR family transcriptional regulator